MFSINKNVKSKTSRRKNYPTTIKDKLAIKKSFLRALSKIKISD